MEAAQESINVAFAKDANLRKRIFDAINITPQYLSLFHDIANFQLANAQPSTTNGYLPETDLHSSKKRKLDSETSSTEVKKEQPQSTILEARDLSFTLPLRKKLHLSILQYGQTFSAPDTSCGLCLRNPATNQVEVELPLTAFAYILKVPVPEKAQKQHNFCLLPRTEPSAIVTPSNEAVIWSVNDGPLKSCLISSPDLEEIVAGADDVLEQALNALLQRTGDKVIVPVESEFASAVPEAHRKNEKSYHVKAHRGSKDGYLFFLENGIFFGFKKPLAFFPFHEIESVSYTAVLQRTFNLIITTQGAQERNDVEPQEIEFAMIDQADFAGIDAYIKKHQLQDASLADARRAKQYKVNGKSATQETGADGQSELQKAEAEMQEDEEDEEDAMEEDYDPGSEGESEGSGSSEDEDDYEDTNTKGGDLVKDELGSEAEDVSADEDEEEQLDEDEEEEDEGTEEVPQVQAPSKSSFTPISTTPKLPIHPAGAPSYDDEDQL